MAHVEVTSFFTRGGTPAIGINGFNPAPDGNNYPLVRIWDITDGIYNLVVGAPNGSGSNQDELMSEVVDGASDGFYLYLFDTTDGYDDTLRYLVRSDGGPTLPEAERYQVATIEPDLVVGVDVDSIADAVWDETNNDHLLPGSTGLALAQTKANTEQLLLDTNDIETLLSVIMKYDTNRTKIDPSAKTLTVYDDNCTDVLRVFNLYDQNGNPSVDSVCERVPVDATDGQPTC